MDWGTWGTNLLQFGVYRITKSLQRTRSQQIVRSRILSESFEKCRTEECFGKDRGLLALLYALADFPRFMSS